MRTTQSPLRTLRFAASVALVCSLFVTTAVYWLRPIQAAYGALEYNRVIVAAAGLIPPDAALSDRDVVSRFLELETRIVDLELDWYTDAVDPLTYDYRPLAATRERPRYMPVYLLEQLGRLDRVVLPIYGRGMWSTIHGVITLAGDLTTVVGVVFHEHGETPGIGDRIEDAAWLAQWRGKRLYTDSGELMFAIGAAGRDASFRVDGITGATVTVSAVAAMIDDWFGPDGYGPYLAALRGGRDR